LARTGRHRIAIPDLIIAAAEAAGLILLHYDHDYDMIAEVTRQPVEWVVERGSV
jgi:predicted nucleic acid-binding protein